MVLALLGIVSALASAGFFMLRKPRQGERRDSKMARALAVRVGISVGLFMVVLFSYWMGWVQPTGIPVSR